MGKNAMAKVAKGEGGRLRREKDEGDEEVQASSYRIDESGMKWIVWRI